MAYTPIHAWKRKDKLPSKDPQKIIYGEQLQDEFDAISRELNDLDGQDDFSFYSLYGSSVYGVALYGIGAEGNYDDAQIRADLSAETSARIAGDADLQTQIDNLPSGGGGGSTWDGLTGKPAEFPPEAHGHEEIAKDAAYIKYEGDTWKASPSMEVDGNLSVSGDSTLTGGLEVSGNIEASGSISVDGDLAITGKIEGDLTVNGNITIDGGQIVDPDGNPSGGLSTHVGPDAPDPAVGGQMWLNSDDGYLYVYYENAGNPTWMAVEREGGSGGGGDGGGGGLEGVILQLDGEEAGSSFTDRAGRTTVTGAGGAKNSAADSKYGSGCLDLGSGAGLEVSGVDMSIIAAGSFTFEAWIKIASTGSGGNNNRYPIFSQMSAGGNSFYFNLVKGGANFSAIGFTHVAGYSNSSGEHTLQEDPMDGGWHHYACCWDADNNKSYVFYDGVLKGTSQASQGLSITGGKIMINRSAYTSVDDQFGDGLYDDIRVSNYVRYTSDFSPPGELGTSRQALVRNYTEDSNDADLS